MTRSSFSRRRMIKSAVAFPAVASLAFPARKLLAQSATPACERAQLTKSQTEGPFFTPQTPEKQDFRNDAADGHPITLEAVVRDRACQVVPSALIELWHAGPTGQYDNRGYRFRGHQITDAMGRFRFQTFVPGLYPGRTRHFHIKVLLTSGKSLTTQLYFPDEPGNAIDWGYNRELVMDINDQADGTRARFDFVV